MRAFYRALIIANIIVLILVFWSGSNGYRTHYVYDTLTIDLCPWLGLALCLASISTSIHSRTKILGIILVILSFLAAGAPHLAY